MATKGEVNKNRCQTEYVQSIQERTPVMAYTSNPFMPKARKKATNLVKKGYSPALVARMYGVHRSTIGRWMKKSTNHNLEHIQTGSSRPHSHPNQLPDKTVQQVIKLRKETGRCAVVLHHLLEEKGVKVSLSSVKRIIKRYKLIRKRKRRIEDGTRFKRPPATSPGSLVQIDTIHYVHTDYSRSYIYAVIDLYSRMAYAEHKSRISSMVSLDIINKVQKYFPFDLEVIQTDNGQEFGQKFLYYLNRKRIKLRHSRVKRPNDNAHVERLNRTIQEECFKGMNPQPRLANKKIKQYIDYYNYHRPHLGIQCKTPAEMLQRS